LKKGRSFFTSESVTEGHPDKVADQISDAVLDAMLADDPESRVACETALTAGLAFVAGEITTKTYVEIPDIVRETIRDIGYTRATYGFDYEFTGVVTSIQKQSPDIALGTGEGLGDNLGAGDQGMMFGFACTETPELMPAPIMYAHKLARRLAAVRKDETLPYLRPDGKTQVTIEYDGYKPVRVDTILIAAQHAASINGVGGDREKVRKTIRDGVFEYVIKPVIPADMLDNKLKYYVNETGWFTVGGPQADTGLTGRKIIVDTYGGMARHGGGCFSGKDPSKVDRSASYMVRYVAKNVVAAGLADRCEIQVAYAIGRKDPLSVYVETFGTGKIDDAKIEKLILDHFDFTPRSIINHFKLQRPIYKRTAAYGHFGRDDLDVPWEATDMADTLRSAV
jgi:S-adenosylmethionine synthetase